MRSLLRQRLRLLANPAQEFGTLNKTTLEHAVAEHLKLLFACAIGAAVLSFVWFTGRAIYLDMAYTIDVNYMRMLNYGLGQAGGYGLFYMVSGTLLLLIVSMLLRIFVSVRYTLMLAILLYATTPLLLFGWLPVLVPSLAIWSVFLFIVGVRTWKAHG